MAEYALKDITLQDDLVSGTLRPEDASEIRHYINSLKTTDYVIKLLIEAIPVRQHGLSINSARAEAGFPEFSPKGPPAFEVTVTVRPAQ
jgi:hypothetical protein